MDSGDVAAVPQASYHIEVSSADGSTPPTESVQSPPPSGGGGGAARSVVVLRAGSDGGEARGVKYVLTGATARQGAAVGVTPVKSPAVGRPPSGQATSAARARQILKKRHDLSMAEKKYTKMLHPDLNASGAELGDGAQSGSAPVMICEPEPEAGVQQGQARTLFFVAKPPEEAIKEEQDAVQEEAEAPVPQLPDGPAPSTDDPADELGVLRRLARFKLSERYEILPAASLEDAEEIMHRLRVQNLALKTEMVRLATEFERHDDEHGLRSRRGRKKRTTIVAVDRLRELEKIEAGMHTLFTPSQVKTLSRDYKKNSVQWRDEDFRRALGLLEHSNQHTFNYVRKVMNIPLPSIGTLKLRCPSQPELHVRLEAALRERGDMGRSGRRMSGHGAVGDAGDGVGGEHAYPEMQTDDGRQEDDWIAVTPTRGILKRKRSSGGAASARKVTHQDEEVVFYEAPAPVAQRGRGRRGVGRRGGSSASTPRHQRGLVEHYEPPPPPPPPPPPQEEEEEEEEPEFDDDEEDDEDDEPEDAEDFEEEFGEEIEIDPEQQEVPAHYEQYRYEDGDGTWTTWDPRQLQ